MTRVPMTRVAVLYGGMSAEREVSLATGRKVIVALREAGYTVTPVEVGSDLGTVLKALDPRPDAVFNALHGRFGEDGTVQGALELLGLPYTGSGVMASSVAMDKIFTKRIWLSHGLPTPAFEVVQRGDVLRELPDRLGLPLILKPPHEGSTIGISKVSGYSEIAEAFELAARYDDTVLAEQFIRGRELTVAILGRGRDAFALPVIEIQAPGGNYDYQNKYFGNDTRYLCPAPLSPQTAQEVQRVAVEAYRALECEGWARADLMLDADDRPWLLEMNTSPGMTDHSLVPMAAKAVGMDYDSLVVRILESARLKVHTAA